MFMDWTISSLFCFLSLLHPLFSMDTLEFQVYIRSGPYRLEIECKSMQNDPTHTPYRLQPNAFSCVIRRTEASNILFLAPYICFPEVCVILATCTDSTDVCMWFSVIQQPTPIKCVNIFTTHACCFIVDVLFAADLFVFFRLFVIVRQHNMFSPRRRRAGKGPSKQTWSQRAEVRQ